MSRIPIRARLTLSFALLMAVVLAATGYFIYARVGSALLDSVDQSLRTQAAEIAGHADRSRGLDRDRADAPQVAQELTAAGTTASSTPVGLPPILRGQRLASVVAGGRLWWSGSIAGLDNDWRVLAVPGRVDGRPGAIVLARSLEPRDEALSRLVRELLLGGAAALLLATIAGYALTASALRPVEAMRRRAAAVTAETPGQRLPVPPARDELARLAVTLNDMLGRLEAAFEHERRFVDDASHELRTPLALLKTELELALRHPRSRDELERALGAAAAETDDLIRLAEDLLLVARADQGELPLRTERLSVRSLFEDVAERFSADAATRGRSIAVAGSDAFVDGDRDRLAQALGNLVENALLHGGGSVVLTAEPHADELELHVLDAGLGVPSDFRPRAFDRFSRADPARTSSGAGLGLAIVELIARRHGGHAELRDRPGGGTDAVLVLPHAAENAPQQRQPRAAVPQI